MIRVLPAHWYLPTVGGVLKNALKRQSVYPFYASFKLTTRCHFGCPFCNVKKSAVTDMSTDDIKKILDNLSRSPVLMTSFEGGEPLLRQDIGELLQYARKCHFYLLFTTSVKNIRDYPIREYARYIDFLHVSIDEGHNNLDLLNELPFLTQLPCQVSVQTVVTKDTLDALETKVKACFENGANIVVIPAAHMDKTEDYFPDMDGLEKKVEILRKKYPSTIHTPQGFFKAWRNQKCSSGSVIIAPSGHLYYPCHILGTTGPDLRTTDLTKWLSSPDASDARKVMSACERNCGWYQYYSIDSYTSVGSVIDALRPILKKRKQKPF